MRLYEVELEGGYKLKQRLCYSCLEGMLNSCTTKRGQPIVGLCELVYLDSVGNVVGDC